MLKTNKKETVKRHFENSHVYLGDNMIIHYRAEIIKDFLRSYSPQSIIDVACGDAQISKQFLSGNNRLTLVDISESMLSTAEKNIPKKFVADVEFIRGDFEKDIAFSRKFDLVICTGLLAHVDNYRFTTNSLASLVGDKGYLVVQNTNASHLYTCLNRFYRIIISMLAKEKYKHNRIRGKDLNYTIKQKGFEFIGRFRYISSFMFLSKIIRGHTKYRFVYSLFGLPSKPRFQFLGNEEILLFRKNDI